MAKRVLPAPPALGPPFRPLVPALLLGLLAAGACGDDQAARGPETESARSDAATGAFDAADVVADEPRPVDLEDQGDRRPEPPLTTITPLQQPWPTPTDASVEPRAADGPEVGPGDVERGVGPTDVTTSPCRERCEVQVAVACSAAFTLELCLADCLAVEAGPCASQARDLYRCLQPHGLAAYQCRGRVPQPVDDLCAAENAAFLLCP